MTIGLAILNRRRELGMSQVELARLVGMDHTYLSKIERNRLTVSDKLLTKIYDALGMMSLNENDRAHTTLAELEYRIGTIMQELEEIRNSIKTIRQSDSTLGGEEK